MRTGRDEYLFTFSPTGVESFYALPEEVASKGLADYLMLRRKLPNEIFDGRRTMPHLLFRKGDVVHYLANLDQALDATVAELGDSGSVDLFALTRRLGHRMGLASWAGPGCAEGAAFERLVVAFDQLDGSDSFVHPDAMAAVAASDKAAERAALAEVTEILGASVDAPGSSGLFARIVESWAGPGWSPSVSRGTSRGAARTSATVTTARKQVATVSTRLVYASPPSASLRIARTSCGTSTALNTPPASRM